MALRDHFRPPLDLTASWEGFHGGWPMVIVQHLRHILPDGYTAEPRVHSGSQVEIDVAAYQHDDLPRGVAGHEESAATAWAPEAPSVAVDTGLPEYDEYEVRIYDMRRGRHLVAAIELVSPANKDRIEHRNVFVAKCAALLRHGIAVSIVDVVTIRHFNLYADLLNFIGHADPTLGDPPPHLYAASCRWVRREDRTILECWSRALVLGQTLPTLPLWLRPNLSVPLGLEASYEQTCKDLWIE